MTVAADRPGTETGFSLVEVVIATGIMAVGLLSLLGVLALGLHHMAGSSPGLIAREKAREAIESVHAARDTDVLSWPTIRNVSQGGVFLNGEQPLNDAGDDGLINTADDGDVEEQRMPGPDGVLGNSDDELVELTGFTREIQITDLMNNDGSAVDPNLRRITVTVRYRVEGAWRTYTLTTYISRFA